MLNLEFDGQNWIERGVLIFSQFYDSAYALAEYLQKHFDEPIGLYANSSASKLFEGGQVQSVDRELLKEKVTQGRLKLLIGTDAASTGLNLQRLGCLINLDLPWNPTILEQRKGRVQRGTLAKRIPFYNMRYDKGAEQKLFETLYARIQEDHGHLRHHPRLHRRSMGDRHAGRQGVGREHGSAHHRRAPAEPLHAEGNHRVTGYRLGGHGGGVEPD